MLAQKVSNCATFTQPNAAKRAFRDDKALTSLPMSWHGYEMTLPGHQYQRIADFFADVAQISIASMFVPYVLDDFRPVTALWGMAFAIFFWSMSLFFNRNAV